MVSIDICLVRVPKRNTKMKLKRIPRLKDTLTYSYVKYYFLEVIKNFVSCYKVFLREKFSELKASKKKFMEKVT